MTDNTRLAALEAVEVRAHVYLDLADGGFVIHEAGYEVSPRYRRHVATLTARVLLPTVPTITAAGYAVVPERAIPADPDECKTRREEAMAIAAAIRAIKETT